MRKMSLLFLLAVVGCELPTHPAVSGPSSPAKIDTSAVVIDWERPYPIHLEWWFCEWRSPETCEAMDDPYSVMPAAAANGIYSSTAEWARVLAPTPVAPAVAERDFSCYGGPRTPKGSQLPPGTTIQIVVTDEDRIKIGGGARYFVQDEYGVPVLVVCHYYTLRALEQDHEAWLWYNVGLHESGHGFMDGPAWQRSKVVSSDSTMAWVTDSSYVAAFDAMGGSDFEGEKVLTDWPWCEGCHWNTCIAPREIMATVWYPDAGITNLTLSALLPGFQARAQRNRLRTDRWDDCPGTTSGNLGLGGFDEMYLSLDF